MKVSLINYAFVAAMTTLAAMVGTDEGLTLPLNITLKPNSIDVLAANGIWAPNISAFAAGKPNVDGVNFTAESEKLAESGLDVNDLVLVTIDDKSPVTVSSHKSLVAADDHRCDHCKLCLKACAAALLLWFLWVASLPLLSPLPPSS